MFCALLTLRYQVSVYRTNGPLVIVCHSMYILGGHCETDLFVLVLGLSIV